MCTRVFWSDNSVAKVASRTAGYFLHYLPEPANLAEAVAGAISVAGTVSVPAGAPYNDFGVCPTWWTSAIDITNLTYPGLVGDVTARLTPTALTY
jgi:penicillin V acylase-like amidase (Ntn superfamily)